MNWLAFDTSTDVLSVAVSRGDQTWVHDSPGGAQASRDGLPTVLRLMDEANLRWTDLQGIVMGRGPGAFTGLRTACAMAQGLAWGASLQVLPVDTLLAVAETAYTAHPQQAGRERMLVAMDARMHQAYVAAYEREDDGATHWRCVMPPHLSDPTQVRPPAHWQAQAYCLAGNAHAVYPALVDAPALPAMPSAEALIRLAPLAWAQGDAVDPQDALPLYVRDKVAQTTAERMAERKAERVAERSDDELRLQPLTMDQLDAVVHIEQQAYSHPWTRGNFADSIQAGYHLRALMKGEQLMGYYVAMAGVQEVHLLNITVTPSAQRQGLGRLLLDAMHIWARQQQAQWAWLEVRASNARAMQVYERYGYRRVGLRKGYYPDHHGHREDAVVMSYKL